VRTRCERHFAFFAASDKADFADCLIDRSGHVAQCEYTATFDVTASKVVGMVLVK
jgi:predicted nucleic-acid-binding protein